MIIKLVFILCLYIGNKGHNVHLFNKVSPKFLGLIDSIYNIQNILLYS